MAESQTVEENPDVEQFNSNALVSVTAKKYGTMGDALQVPCDLDRYDVNKIKEMGYTFAYTCNDNLVFTKE